MRRLRQLAILAAGLSAIQHAARADPLSPSSLNEINGLYQRLIDAENRHDLAAVQQMVWQSPDTLFVAKTASPAEGNWAGFWGADVVIQHFAELYAGTFVMAPHYDRVKTVGLAGDVAETYAPLDISVSYAGQTATPKPFLMIVTWVRTPDGWKMATDVALPIPPAPASNP
jgi:ketosteroid isomerase-like protein